MLVAYSKVLVITECVYSMLLVREYRQVRVEVGLEPRKPARVRRTFRYHWDEDGMLVLSGRLSAEEGALVLKALEAGTCTLERDRQRVDEAHADNTDELEVDTRETCADVSAEAHAPTNEAPATSISMPAPFPPTATTSADSRPEMIQETLPLIRLRTHTGRRYPSRTTMTKPKTLSGLNGPTPSFDWPRASSPTVHARSPAPPPPTLDHPGDLKRFYYNLATPIASDACVSKWDGGSMDYCVAVEALLQDELRDRT